MTIRNEFILIAILGILLLALIAAGVEGVPAPLPLLRLLLGLAFVLFVPGYALQAALFAPADGLDGPERLALSFGLSVAVVPPLALLLDWLPWGIRLWPIVIGEGLVIALCSAVALFRRRRLPAEARPVLVVSLDLKSWWAELDRTNRVLYSVLVGALVLAAISATLIIVLPKPGEQFTEFYMLGPEGLAENYPREAVAGEPVTVTVGITNREGVPADYRVEVMNGELPVGSAGPVRLDHEQTDERPVSFAPAEVGDDVKIIFNLYRDGGAEPYRSLRLWIKVKASS